jgi:hypothetical protein
MSNNLFGSQSLRRRWSRPQSHTHTPLHNLKVLTPQEHKGLQKIESIEGQNVAHRHISSIVIVSPEMLAGDNCYLEGQHQKVNTK